MEINSRGERSFSRAPGVPTVGDDVLTVGDVFVFDPVKTPVQMKETRRYSHEHITRSMPSVLSSNRPPHTPTKVRKVNRMLDGSLGFGDRGSDADRPQLLARSGSYSC
jgi:hypothetical protein